jgi:hypothetical protein
MSSANVRLRPTLVLVAALALAQVLAPRPASAREGAPEHAFGLGLELGAPTGLVAKYYLGSSGGRGGMMALQGGIGYINSWGPDGVNFHLDVLWHPAVIARTPSFTMPFYLGVGGRVLDWRDEYCYVDRGIEYCDGDGDVDVGVRVPFGILMDFQNVPIDVFFELAFVLDLIHIDNNDYTNHERDYVNLNGAIGARFYF